MASSVSIRPAIPADEDDILQYILEQYMKEETICQALEAPPNAAWRAFWQPFVAGDLQQSFSFVARDEAHDNRLAGVRLAGVSTPAEYQAMMNKMKPEAFDDAHLKRMMRLMQMSAQRFDLTKSAVGVSKKMLLFHMIGVHPDYQRRGIGQKLTKVSMESGREHGCDYLVVNASGLKPQALFEKMGMQLLERTPFADFKDEAGQPLIVPKNGSVSINTYYQKL